MIYTQSFIFGDSQKGGEYSGWVKEQDFFCYFKMEGGFTQEQGEHLKTELSQTFASEQIATLERFEEQVRSLLQKENVPLDSSFAIGYKKDTILYLKTTGGASIYIKRGGQLKEIIHGDSNASGFIKENDVLILSTSRFFQNQDGKNIVARSLVGGSGPKEEELKDVEEMVLFIAFQKEAEQALVEDSVEAQKSSSVAASSSRFSSVLKNKKVLFIAGTIVLSLFIFNLVFSLVKTNLKMVPSKFDESSETIKKKITQAKEESDTAFTNSLQLISETKADIDSLAKSAKSKQEETKIGELKKLLQQTEQNVLKIESKTPEEFYDISLEDKNANGSRLYLSENTLLILNGKGRIYSLSLEKKSIDKVLFDEIQNATLVAGYDSSIFFYKPNAGIYKIVDAGKPKKIIDNDSEWGKIIDMNIYNGNIYVLDKEKSEIYKYLVAETGYSGKTSYNKSETKDFSGANSLAIDSAVYVGLSDGATKFNGGLLQDFKLVFPTDQIQVEKVITNKELEKIYVWDKKYGILFVMSKEGAYERQIRSTILKEGTDVVVFGSGAYILKGSKIDKLSL